MPSKYINEEQKYIRKLMKFYFAGALLIIIGMAGLAVDVHYAWLCVPGFISLEYAVFSFPD